MDQGNLKHCVSWHHFAEFRFKHALNFLVEMYGRDAEKELDLSQHC